MLCCGNTFLLPKSAYLVEHLWIVITEPEAETSNAVCVNVTTRNRYSETTVVLAPGDHPFINHDSVINYRDARKLNLAQVYEVLTTKMPQRFAFGIYDPCSPQLLKRIQDGLLASPHAANGIKECCKNRWKVTAA